jgi:hypothetical protein
MSGRRFLVWPQTRLLRSLVALLVLLSVVAPPSAARAGESLLATPREDVPLGRDTAPTMLTADTNADPAVTPGERLVEPEEDPAVKLSRLRQEANRLRGAERAAFGRLLDLSSARSLELATATQEHLAAKQAVVAAEERVKAAAFENRAATQAAIRSAEKLRYGPDGPTTAASLESALQAAAGIAVGMPVGTVSGVLATASSLLHPVDTLSGAYRAVTAPAPSPEEQLRHEAESLQQARSRAVTMVNDPFGASFEGGQLIGEFFLAPSATGQVLGAFGKVVRAGQSAAAETGAWRLLTRPETAKTAPPLAPETVAARQAVARDYYLSAAGIDEARFLEQARGIDFSESVEVVKVAKGTTLYQWVQPGRGAGRYFSYDPLTPEMLGIYAGARQLKRFVVTEDVSVLRSTAAPMLDTWTVPGQSYPVPGRGTQLFANKPQVIELVE